MEVFGETPFAPRKKEEALALTKKQEELLLSFDGKASQISNTYMPGDERSFTIIPTRCRKSEISSGRFSRK